MITRPITSPISGPITRSIPGRGFSPLNPDFEALFADAGNGAVTTTLTRGTGAITMTRATAAACRLSTGLWKLDVASGVLRSHYWEFSPGVYTYGGALGEGAATQLCLDPRNMTTANWALGATLTRARTQPGIDGAANTATRLTGGAVAATNTILQTLTAAASSRTYSAFIKRISGTGAIGITQDGSTFTDISAQLNTTSFVQVQLNATQLNAVFGLRVSTNGDVIDVDCNQFEAGASASTPIPAAGTRNADVPIYPYTGNMNSAAGVFYAEVATMISSAAAILVAVGMASNRSPVSRNSTTGAPATVIRSVDATVGVLKTGLTSMLTGVRKRAGGWGPLGQMVTGDGAVPEIGTFNGSMGNTNIAVLCNTSGTGNWGGTVKVLRGWKNQPNAVQLAALTA